MRRKWSFHYPENRFKLIFVWAIILPEVHFCALPDFFVIRATALGERKSGAGWGFRAFEGLPYFPSNFLISFIELRETILFLIPAIFQTFSMIWRLTEGSHAFVFLRVQFVIHHEWNWVFFFFNLCSLVALFFISLTSIITITLFEVSFLSFTPNWVRLLPLIEFGLTIVNYCVAH